MKIPQIKLVFDRKRVATRKKAGLVQVEISYMRKRKYISTGVKLFKHQWSGDSRVIYHNSSAELNSMLNDIVEGIYAQIKDMADNGYIDINQICIKDESACKNFADYYAIEMDNIKNENTKRTYRHALSYLQKFGGFGSMESISVKDIQRFNQFMINCGLAASSRKLYHDKIKAVLERAVKNEMINGNPYSKFTFDKCKSRDVNYLTEDELAQIINHEWSGATKRCVDLFLFQCFTGLSYADAQSLSKDMVVSDGDKLYIERKRVKTGVYYRITMLPVAKKIWLEYDGKLPRIAMPNYLFSLRKVREELGFTKKLTSHVARHTFATWALSNGVPIEIVSKMLGHTNITTTQIYAKVLAKDVDAGFDLLADKFK